MVKKNIIFLIIGLFVFLPVNANLSGDDGTLSERTSPVRGLVTKDEIVSNGINVITIDNRIINPVIEDYVIKNIKKAEEEKANCLVIRLDTPGGLLESTRRIVKQILNSKVPVVVYVSPSGSRAGSAGVFITMASHIAVMAPTTNIGAAHPIAMGSPNKIKKFFKKATDTTEVEERDVMSEKIMNDLLAWVTTIARKRKRNIEWYKKAVTESVSIDEEEALKKNVITLIVKNMEELKEKVHNIEVSVSDRNIILNTKDASVNYIELSSREKFLDSIINPNVVYILMLLGMFGLIFEFTHPGIGFPGIAGAICLLLSFYAFNTLPVNYVGIGFIVLGIILFIAEANFISYGLLSLGGITCMLLGSVMLFDTPYRFMQVSFSVMLPVILAMAGLTVFLVTLAVKAQSRRVATGAESLIGEVGIARTDIGLEGKIFVHGELWNAESTEKIKKGEKVVVRAVENLKIKVHPFKDK